MHDINKIRQEPDLFCDGLKKRGLKVDIEKILKIDSNLREIISEIQSFQEQRHKETPMNHDFKNKLEELTINENDIKNELSCAICLDNFKLNDKIIKLPCNNTPHYFHKDNNVNHVGMFIDDNQFIHSSSYVKINSISLYLR